VRRARTTTGTGVLCARYMCPRAVEAPGACAARSGCHKLRTVPGAALQRRPAGARRRRGRQPRGLRDARPRREPDGGHSAPAPGAAARRGARWAPPARRGRPGGVPSRWPAGRGRRGAGAAGWAPASSGGVLASFLLRHVGVCAGADRCGVLLLCVASQGGFSQRCR
jgi:hypothetical protein